MAQNSKSLSRVVITGLGAICSVGQSVPKVWTNLCEGKSGISALTNVDPKLYPVRIAGQVKDFTLDPNLMSEKDQPRFDRFIHFALHCADEALKQSGLLQSDFDPYRVGSIMGVGLGGFPFIEEVTKIYAEKGPRRVGPFFIPSMIPNMATGKISMLYNLRGINHAVSSACASAAHAICAGANEIMLGRQDALLVGGSEAVLSGLTFAGFNSMRALSKRNDEPELASRPFDEGRDGFVMGEGASLLVIESLENAQKRGADILAEIAGFASTSDAYHITAPEPDGAGTVPCMQQAIAMAGIQKEEIDYINAHGTSTPVGDLAETKAIKNVFGEHAYKLNVSSTKSMTGHLLGAAGALESMICVKAIEEQTCPPTINLENPSPECDLNYTAKTAQKRQIKYALNNSFGFGGTNSTLIFKSFEG